MPARFGIAFVVLLLAGCDAELDRFADRLTGQETIVIASAPLTLKPTPLELSAPQPMKVLGHWSSVCLVVGDGVASADATPDKFKRRLNGVTISVSVHLSDGSRRQLSAPMPAWRKFGAIAGDNELAGCAGSGCLDSLPKDSFVTAVELSAEPSLDVRGVYWWSAPDPSERPAQRASSADGKSQARGACG
jgi:hypothetical protein